MSSQPSATGRHPSGSDGRAMRTVSLPSLVLLLLGLATCLLPGPCLGAGLRPPETLGQGRYSVKHVQATVRAALRRQKVALWERLLDDYVRPLHAQGRVRRAAEGDKELMTMAEQDALGTFIGEVMTCKDIPGLSLGLVRGGVRQALGYGVADMDTARPVDPHTLFGIGSNTKAFAAATVARLMLSLPPDKRFTFDTPLKEFLDDFRLGDDMRTREVSLADVLSHRTGLGSADLGLFAGYPHNMTTKDMCMRLRFLPDMAPFRSAWYYSNTLLILVSRVCQAMADTEWVELADQFFFQPLDMNNTFLITQAMQRENVALPYILRMRVDDMFVKQDARLFDIHPLEAAGAIMTSATDMTKWLAYLLDVIKRPKDVAMRSLRDLFRERTLLPEVMRQFASILTPEPIYHVGYDLGFITSYYKGHAVHWHTGDLHGYNSYVLLSPSVDTAVYVAVNGPSVSPVTTPLQHMAYFVLELLQGNRPWTNATLLCPELATAAPTTDPYDSDYDYHGDDNQDLNVNAQKLLRPLEDYLGTYGHGLLGDLHIVQETERNSLVRMELGRFLVADLIPTESEYIFKVAARPPVSDTKEFEEERTITFKYADQAPATGSDSVAPGPEASKASEKGDHKNGTTAGDAAPKRPPLEEVHIRWEKETYAFKRSVRFASALDEEDEKDEEDEGGSEEDSSGLPVKPTTPPPHSGSNGGTTLKYPPLAIVQLTAAAVGGMLRWHI